MNDPYVPRPDWANVKRGRCKWCGRPVVWAINDVGGKANPLDPQPCQDGSLIVKEQWNDGDSRPVVRYLRRPDEVPSDVPRFRSHFLTCPAEHQAKDRRRRQGTRHR